MFRGRFVQRKNDIIEMSKYDYFKFLDFYNASNLQKKELLSNLKPTKIVSCHRQYQFDFGIEHKVISVVLDDLSWIGKRVCDIHISRLGKQLSNKKLLQLQSKISIDQIVTYEYQNWAKNNILDADIKLPFSMLQDDQFMTTFCQDHNLKYNRTCIDDILNNVKKYT